MAKQTLAATTSQKDPKLALLDLSDKQAEQQPRQEKSLDTLRRSTGRLTISLLDEEKRALEELAFRFRQNGHPELKTSRLARIAFCLLLDTADEEILKAAEKVENLEERRGNRY
jgi:hypothetical protein